MKMPRKLKKQIKKRKHISNSLRQVSMALLSACLKGKELEALLKSRSYHE